MLKHGGGHQGLKEFYDIINGEQETNNMLADIMMEKAETLRFMQEKNKKD